WRPHPTKAVYCYLKASSGEFTSNSSGAVWISANNSVFIHYSSLRTSWRMSKLRLSNVPPSPSNNLHNGRLDSMSDWHWNSGRDQLSVPAWTQLWRWQSRVVKPTWG